MKKLIPSIGVLLALWLSVSYAYQVKTSQGITDTSIIINPTTGAAYTALPVTISGSSVNATKTDKSGSITTGGTAQTLMASNSSRKGWEIQNTSTGDLWFNEIGSTAVQASPSFKLEAGGSAIYESAVTTTAISIIGATTGQTFTAREW